MLNSGGEESVNRLLAGGFDLHVHSGPCRFPRAYDDVELLEVLHAAGMGGAVIKSHFQGTSSRATMANRVRPGTACLFGGIALNHPVGGINPSAVESEILFGGKIVWFPTIDAENNLAFSKGLRPADRSRKEGIRIFTSEGMLCKEVLDVLDIVIAADVILATGHLSRKEALALCAEAIRRGHSKIILTHPDWGGVSIPLSEQISLAKQGVFIEKCLLNVDNGDIEVSRAALDIAAIGAARCLVTTDYGKSGHAPVPDGLARFLSLLIDNGVSTEEVSMMIRRNPAYLLGMQM